MTRASSTTIPSSTKLTDTQLVALSAATQRPDHCIAPPEHLKGGAVAKFAGSLIAKGVAEEMQAEASMPIFRRDGEQAFALVITATGFAALGIEQPELNGALAAQDLVETPQLGHDGAAGGQAASSSVPREGTKLAQVIAMLERSDGAAIRRGRR
jgi:hypothetical protein